MKINVFESQIKCISNSVKDKLKLSTKLITSYIKSEQTIT